MEKQTEKHDFGLDKETMTTITRILNAFPEVEQACIFGSRAMGNYRPASDIDIALKGAQAEKVVGPLRSMLENAPRFPYKVDVVAYDTIQNAELRKHIDEYGVRVEK